MKHTLIEHYKGRLWLSLSLNFLPDCMCWSSFPFLCALRIACGNFLLEAVENC